MQPQPERISPRSGKLTNFTAVPNSVVQHQKMLTPAELRLVLLVLQWREATITDETWQEKTGLDKRMKAMAIKGLREKGLHVSGAGKRAKYFFDVNGWDSWVRTRPRHERAHTTGRSKSVSAKPGMQIHQECRDGGCSRMRQNEVIPFLQQILRNQFLKKKGGRKTRHRPNKSVYRGSYCGPRNPPEEISTVTRRRPDFLPPC